MAQDISNLIDGRKPAQANPTSLSAIRKRGRKTLNLWIFDSPKNNSRLTIAGDVPFMHLVLLEGDLTVAGYDLVDDPFNISSPDADGYVRVRCHDDTAYWLVIRRRARKSVGKNGDVAVSEYLLQKAISEGVQVQTRSEYELEGQAILFDNWLTLCAIMTRARQYTSYFETEQLLSVLDRHASVRVSDLLDIRGTDRAIMLAAIAKAIQIGMVQTELNRCLFGTHSQLKRVRW